MQRHTSDIYRKNFYLPFNLFINIKIGFLYKTIHHHIVQISYKIFYKKHSIPVLSKHMKHECPPPPPPLAPHLIT